MKGTSYNLVVLRRHSLRALRDIRLACSVPQNVEDDAHWALIHTWSRQHVPCGLIHYERVANRFLLRVHDGRSMPPNCCRRLNRSFWVVRFDFRYGGVLAM